jgi:hypothetical protein
MSAGRGTFKPGHEKRYGAGLRARIMKFDKKGDA